jgi:Phage minor structural protein GP20.
MQILDRGKIAAEGGELKGLKEQIEQLKESDGYLFEDEAPARGGRQIENGGDVGKFDMNQAIRQAAGK